MKIPLTALSLLLSALWACTLGAQDKSDKKLAYVKAPFTQLDTLCTNDWWNRAKGEIIDVKVCRDSVIAFGAYTVANNVLKLSAQLFPLYPEESREVTLSVKRNGEWAELQHQPVNELGWSVLFRVENWNEAENIPYRLSHELGAIYEGTIRTLPQPGTEVTMAALSCNSSFGAKDRFNYTKNINVLDPDIIFFAGDQSYYHKEHTAGWLLFGVQFRETFRHRPMISIPDDHDIGQANLWGEGGKKATTTAGHNGGYFFHPAYVKMVERCQTAHLPDPVDPDTIAQGIGVYFTSYQLGSVDFAIVEDRKFKSGPNGKIPQQGPRPDHIRNPDYDPASIDLPGLKLLGDRQLNFLDKWATQTKNGVAVKAVLSQTGFCGGAHVHGDSTNRLHADLDSNGWPQTGRNQALEKIKKANAVHIAGDQHLATVVQHGTDEFRDGPWAFIVPAIFNNYYSRWWWPEDEQPGGGTPIQNELPWTGDYRDGFHNKITMHAYANPTTSDFGAGFGLIRFHTASREVTFECWPRSEDVTQPEAKQFPGWPITIKL
ncbi:alkaline phosphatase D family protein [Tunicatimonas pelagia]|uniref:alkaline phosphatase D family protein n=1 Tax=Tunicatimonas pelagia TaxID=931531 RepID=UPI00266650D7|nr:alkaline phosphatase D family protein [Tunicatimonas pelagia]WKN45466.1 hypothetical protein P0M28_10905 [Tunicatimonas pelagia]